MNELQLSAKAVFKNYTPQNYLPDTPAMFVGPARKIASLLQTKAAESLDSGLPLRLALYGNPGVGKTQLANYFAKLLAGHSTQIQSYNGRNATVDCVRAWQEAAHYLPLYGKFSVKIINELDVMPAVAQDACLSYLDEMGRGNCVIGTSNLRRSELSDHFQSRFQQFKVPSPTTEEIVSLLFNWELSLNEANRIAVASGGNVRAALLDCQALLDERALNAADNLRASDLLNGLQLRP